MTRHPYLVVALTVLAMAAAMAAVSAAPLRSAKVGDPMGSLVAGLIRVDGGRVGSCADGAPIVHHVDYVVPGRPADDDNASLIGFTVGHRVVILVAFDEENLSTPVMVSADRDGDGLVTDVWSVADAPTPCAIVQGIQHHP